MTDKPKLSMLTLGGTIAMTSASASGAVVPKLDAADLLATLPELDIELVTHDFRQLPSPDIGFVDLAALATKIEAEIAAGATGIVVTQGTDTIEESSYFLDRTIGGDVPIVMTGAMRHPQQAGPDGPANLLAAMVVAADPQARGLGTVVVMSDEVHAARYVRKSHSTSTGAFTSPNAAPIGRVVEQELVLLSRPRPYEPLPRDPRLPDTSIGMVHAALGDDGDWLRPFAEHTDGLVIAGFGGGHVPSRLVPLLAELAEAKPVVLASRTSSGPVLTRTYGYPGSEQDLLSRGLINAGFLDPFKARVLLHVLVSSGASRAEIAHIFHDSGEITVS
ncbi:L-asparaginase [Actinosynnema sp. ALI-1.44]|uniref:asparaginase n=1 Tax=Actinosynnema sp. ALI-1.44 TaxID=1933779 RepID=UPI00097C7869|nr:asparaginase [Actinosynnema sp. ALI-1.44]ONI78636.1 L-asparaginase [Actinosynnema sp. ALI-1.44]